MAAGRLLVLAAALGPVLACGGDEPSATCAMIVPTACMPPAPSYAAEVSGIVARHCQPCHRPGGEEAKRPLTTYSQVSKAGIDVLFQVSRCKMPPAGEPRLSADETAALFAWLVCDAPNN